MPNSYAYWREYLKSARNGTDRPINGSRTKRVLHGANKAVRLRYHYTDVVTLYSDGTEVITTGGWNTVTTKRFLSDYSKARVWSEKGQLYVRVRDPKITPPKVWKCRMCHGKGTQPSKCYGPWKSCSGPDRCYGPRYCTGYYRSGTCEHGETSGHMMATCEHGETERHALGTCEHGKTDWHKVGTCAHGSETEHALPDVECWQCKGSGRYDYGSKEVHYHWGQGCTPLVIDSDGYALPTISPEPMGPKPKPAPYVPSPNSGYGDSGRLLGSVLPGLSASVTCPECSTAGTLDSVIIHVNDGHHWTRERIADWLDTLDVDLTFPVPDKIPSHVH